MYCVAKKKRRKTTKEIQKATLLPGEHSKEILSHLESPQGSL